MRVERDNVFARVVGWDTPAERTWLSRVLTYGRRGRGPFATPTRVFDDINDQFLAGLLPDVLTAARGDGVDVQVIDLRPPPPAVDTSADLAWLDPHQRDATAALLKYLRGIVKIPTGGGKTEVAVATMLSFPQVRFGFFAPREQLATQAAERWALRTNGASRGYLLRGRRDLRPRVVFATFQAAAKAANDDPSVAAWLASLGGFFADESHTCAATTFLPVLTRCTGAHIRAGLSATPLDRTDDRAVFTLGALGPVVYEVAPDALVASGRIVAARVVMLRVRQYASSPRDRAPGRVCPGCTAKGDAPCDPDCTADDIDPQARYQAAYDELVVNSTLRNGAIVRAVVAAAKPVLVFVRDRGHGRLLAGLLRAAVGGDIPFVNGDTPQAERRRVARGLNDGTHPVVVAGIVWEAGVDLPALRTVVNAAGGQSAIRTVQVLGRALRAAEGKVSCTIIDIADEGEPLLRKHAQGRMKVYDREGWPVEVADSPA